jgi:cytochrome c556
MIVAGLTLAIGLAGLTTAGHSVDVKPDDIIAGRQAAYDLMGAATGAMKAGVDSGGSVKSMAELAKSVESWGKAIPGMFPAGTETGHNTKAKPEIWSDRAGFEKAAANLSTAAEKLATLASADDKAGFATQFRELGSTCGACHRTYRAR